MDEFESVVINQRGFIFVRKFLRIFLIAFVALAVLLFIFASLASKNDIVEGSGFVRPREEAEIKAQISGRIKSIRGQDGALVRAGDTLVFFVSTDDEVALEKKISDLRIQYTLLAKGTQDLRIQRLSHESNLTQAKLNVEAARIEFEEDSLLNRIDNKVFGSKDSTSVKPFSTRLKKIGWEKAEASLNELEVEKEQIIQKRYEIDTIEREIEKLRLDIALLRKRLERSCLVSPIDGTLLLSSPRTIEGNFVNEGQTVLRVAGAVGWELEARIDNKDAPFVKCGQNVDIHINAFPYMRYKSFEGTVSEIRTAPDEVAGASAVTPSAYTVVVLIKDPYVIKKDSCIGMRKGLLATAKIIIEEKKIIAFVRDLLLEAKAQ